MTSVASLGAHHTSPLYLRNSAARTNAPTKSDQVYDPVLDPRNNFNLQDFAAIPQAGPVGDLPEVQVTAKASKPNADDEPFSFWDVLDLVNPLQHIPGVNTIYRELTGDTIKTPIKVIGSTILGGPIGFAVAMADAAVDKSTGKDIGEHMMAMVKGDNQAAPTPAPATMLAQAPQARVAREMQVAQLATPKSNSTDAAREFVPDPVLMTPSATDQATPQQKGPNEAEAFVKTAQIAAQANVFPTFKRTGGLSAATPEAAAKAQEQAANIQAQQARGQMHFMPLKQNGARAMSAAARTDAEPTSVNELKARTKFAPGPVNAGGVSLAPATLAAATSAQKPASAQEAYEYGRQAAASGKPPAQLPGWFDQAMLGAIDKYKAMQNVP